MKRLLGFFTFAVIAGVTPAAAVAQTLSLQIRDGRVNLEARGVSVKQILDEWARIGQVQFINPEALPTAPTTIVLNDVSEKVALDTLLRDSPGYILGARQAPNGVTEIDRVLLISASPRSSVGFIQTPPDAAPPVLSGQPEAPGLLVIGTGPQATSSVRGANVSGPGAAAAENAPVTNPEMLGQSSPAQGFITPVSQRPPTPFQPGPQAPPPSSVGSEVGSKTPGVISPSGPPPGVIYFTPTVDPNAKPPERR